MQYDRDNEKTISYERELNRLDSIISFLWLTWFDRESSRKTVSSLSSTSLRQLESVIDNIVNSHLYRSKTWDLIFEKLLQKLSINWTIHWKFCFHYQLLFFIYKIYIYIHVLRVIWTIKINYWSFKRLEISETTDLCNPHKFFYLYVIISHNCSET